MTQQQWEEHAKHFDEHILWPATKEEIVAACEGSDVDADVMADMTANLPDDDTEYTQQELHDMLVT